MTTDPVSGFDARWRRGWAVQGLLPLFFLSGATALVWQTLWARELHLLFGTSTFAISTVLAAFMGGLGLGGWWMGRDADRVGHPLAAYGWLEVGIGAYALVFPLIVQAVTPLYLGLGRSLDGGPVVFGLAQFVIVGAALLLPTTLMGATLPLLARFATERLGDAGDRIGLLYGVNTAGAVFGTWFAGFYLLPWVGITWTTGLVAVTNVALGLAALGLARFSPDWASAGVEGDVDAASHPALGAVASAMAIAGFASLIYEVAWTRVLVLMLGASVYAFSVMLLAFLIGIAIGGRWGGTLADRTLRVFGWEGVISLLVVVEASVGLGSWALLWVFPELPFLYVGVFTSLGAKRDPQLVWTASTMIAMLVMTPPAVLMGIAFPVAVRAVVTHAGALGGPVGRIYGANTWGGVLGAALAGFVLLPTIGVQRTVFLAAVANLAAAGVLVVFALPRTPRRWAWMGGVVVLMPLFAGAVFRPPWNPMLMTAGMYQYVGTVKPTRDAIYENAVTRFNLLFYEEGLSSVVTVAQNPKTGNVWLANNGKIDASTSHDMPTQVLVGLLPFAYADKPKDALVIGLASGITAGAVSQVSALERLDVVELEPAIYRAARIFDPYNHHVLDDPRLHMHWNDGRNHVLLAKPDSWDVIVSEPSNPWISGVSNLFTREFMRLGRTRLRNGGVWSQWVQMYGMNREDLRSLLGTFARVWPHALLYATIEYADLVLIGADHPLDPDPKRLFALAEREPQVAAELARVKHVAPEKLASLYLMDRDGMLALAGDVGPNTDDNMRIEYSAPLNLHVETSSANVDLLLEHAQIPPMSDPVLLAGLARVYVERDEVQRGYEAMARAFRLVAKDEADLRPLLDRCQPSRTDDTQRAEAIGALLELDKALMARDTGDYAAFLAEVAAWKDALAAWASSDDE